MTPEFIPLSGAALSHSVGEGVMRVHLSPHITESDPEGTPVTRRSISLSCLTPSGLRLSAAVLEENGTLTLVGCSCQGVIVPPSERRAVLSAAPALRGVLRVCAGFPAGHFDVPVHPRPAQQRPVQAESAA